MHKFILNLLKYKLTNVHYFSLTKSYQFLWPNNYFVVYQTVFKVLLLPYEKFNIVIGINHLLLLLNRRVLVSVNNFINNPILLIFNTRAVIWLHLIDILSNLLYQIVSLLFGFYQIRNLLGLLRFLKSIFLPVKDI